MNDFDDYRRKQLAEISSAMSAMPSIDYGKLFAEQMKPATAALQALQDTLAARSQELHEMMGRIVLPEFTSEVLSNLATLVTPLQFTISQKEWNEFSKVVAEAIGRTNDALERVELLASLGWTFSMRIVPLTHLFENAQSWLFLALQRQTITRHCEIFATDSKTVSGPGPLMLGTAMLLS